MTPSPSTPPGKLEMRTFSRECTRRRGALMIGKRLRLAIALLDQVDGLLDVDDVLDLLRPKQQDIVIAPAHP